MHKAFAMVNKMASWLHGWESENTRPLKKISNLSEVRILNKVQLFLNQSIFFLLNYEGPEFTHSVPVKAALMALTHGVYTVVMVNAAKEMGQRHLQELSDRKRFLTYLNYEYWKKKKRKKKKKKKNSWRRDSNPRPSTILIDSEASSLTAALLRHTLT